jgi:hypothetical protein
LFNRSQAILLRDSSFLHLFEFVAKLQLPTISPASVTNCTKTDTLTRRSSRHR